MDNVKLFKFIDEYFNIPILDNVKSVIYAIICLSLILIGLVFAKNEVFIDYSFIEIFLFITMILILVHMTDLKISNMDNIFALSLIPFLMYIVLIYYEKIGLANIVYNIFILLLLFDIIIIAGWRMYIRNYYINKYDIKDEAF